jgi:RNA polymerase-binding transcription factor DksA
MAPEEIASLRERLQLERDRTVERIRQLEVTVGAIVESGNLDPPDDEHDPEGHTIGFERAFAQSLLDRAREQLAGIERALGRDQDDAYGRCLRCGGPIATERLLAVPDATTCVACASSEVRRRR